MEHKSDSNSSSSGWRKSNFMDKLKHILTHGIMADLTIRLVNGVDIKEFSVHSIFFVMASEVFEKMLQSSFKEGLTRTIEMKNVKPEIFDLLLNYLYGQPLNLSNLDHIKDLTELANYYMMDDLKTEIINYCEKNETDGIAWIGFEVAEICDAPLLKDSKLQYITDNTQTVVNHQNFLKASAETIKIVLEQDYLNIEEIDLFKALEKWIKYNIKGIEESFKEILIRKVRYFSMTPQEFVYGPVSSQLLKSDDSLPLISHLTDGNCLIPLPEGFTKVKRSVKRSSRNRLMLTCLPSTNIGWYKYHYFRMAVQVSKKIWITHLIIYPLITDGVYVDIICIRRKTRDLDEEIAKFEGIVNGCDNFEVKLKQPFLLEAERTYKFFIGAKEGLRKCVNLPGNVLNSGDISFSFKHLDDLPECPLHSILFKV